MRTIAPLTRFGRALFLIGAMFLAAVPPARSATITNTASGSCNGAPLVPGPSTVSLTLATAAVTSALAEIAPNQVLLGSTANAFQYDLLPTIGPADSGIGRVEITAPAGHANLAVTGTRVGGTALLPSCPVPAGGEYCATVSGSVMIVLLGSKVTTTLTNLRVQFTADAPAVAGVADFTALVADGLLVAPAVAGDADGDGTDANSIGVEVVNTQGVVLNLQKSANKAQVVVGEIVTYIIEIRNTVGRDITDVLVDDEIPPDFRYVAGSARLDGAPLPDPAGPRPLGFAIGTVPAFVDGNGNGTADPGEPGYRALLYQLVVGSGATPGGYVNTAVARDYCAACTLSGRVSARVEVRLDPVFDLGTIIGKVFHDRDRDGRQGPGEPGVPGAFVGLDDGTYALADEYGRYHFPAVRPGHRLVKVDVRRLPPGSSATTDESRVVWATPGLMVTADFGVAIPRETEIRGTRDTPAVAVRIAQSSPPVEVRGDVEAPSLVVNGAEVPLPAAEVRLETARLDETVSAGGAQADGPTRFELEAGRPGQVREWALVIDGPGGGTVKAFQGESAPPPAVDWDRTRDDGLPVTPGEIYAYRLDLTYADGSTGTSARRLFGVNRDRVTAIQVQGEAFVSGEAVLSPSARRVLDEAAETIRRYPGERFVIEGHTDSVGPSRDNMRLSKARAESAFRYLVDTHGLPPGQFLLTWQGEDRPAAPNDTAEGRRTNRRVGIKGEAVDRGEILLMDGHGAPPGAQVNGRPAEVRNDGRFDLPLQDGAADRIDLAMTGSTGRSVRAVVTLPTLTITAPLGERLLAYGGSDGNCSAGRPPAEGAPANGDPVVRCRLEGRTEPGNRVEIDGRPVEVDDTGSFTADLSLRIGPNGAGIVVRNAQGLARIANLATQVADHDAEGRLLVLSDGVANLSVDLPPEGAELSAPGIDITGKADPGSEVTVNGRSVPVDADGGFRAAVELPPGPGRIEVRVKDAGGRTASIERGVEVARHQLFLMAFGEGTFGKLTGKGYLRGAGLDEAREYYTDGRAAYYLKGVIAGKYLITSAFDSARGGHDTLLGDLDRDGQRRLLTNLDPDKFYPVYGDLSTVVFDAESQGKFYLALDSDAIHAVVGNYPLSLSDTELSTYRRTLYGGRFTYRSAARTASGDPDTQIVVFGAEVRHAHVHDELRGTGGSIYYLSRGDVVEGSEEITLVVREKNTGLQLTRERQTRNVDYVLKHEEGRVMFQRPIASVAPGGSIVDQGILAGNPVFVLVDYETVVDDFEKTAAGGRVRRQIGDRVAVGGTYVKDELQAGSYELQGADAEVRLGETSRLTAEAARTTGNDSIVNLSTNGGLTYTAVPASGAADGSAWKIGIDLDAGAWVGQPGRHRLRAYVQEIDPGFSSNGNLLEQGTRKTGLETILGLTLHDTMRLRYDREERTAGGPLAAGIGETVITSLQWNRARERWGVSAEIFDADVTGTPALPGRADRTYGAARFWKKLSDRLTARFEHQQTFSGPANDQTTAGVQYQVLPNLALEFLGTGGSLGSSAQAGVAYTKGETSLYLTERLAEDAAGERTTTVLGAKSPIGKSSRVYTEYQWEDAQGGGRTISLLGLQRQWDVGTGMRFLLSGELADADGGSGESSRSAISGGFSYARPDGFRALSRQELRWERAADRRRQYLTINQLDLPVGPDFTLLARFRYSRTEDRDQGGTDARFDERVVGVAYRPVLHDRFNALFKYTGLFDQRPVIAPSDLSTERRTDALSLDTSFRVNRRVEWLAKEAARIMDEKVGDLPSVRTNTYLFIQRFSVEVWKPVGAALEYRMLTQRQADDTRKGWLTEVMWEFTKNFRAGAGYNFTDFSDDVFSQNDYSVRGWFFRVQAKY